MTCAYYNEHEPYCAAWLRNLIAAGHIAPGDVDARDICDLPAGRGGLHQGLSRGCEMTNRVVGNAAQGDVEVRYDEDGELDEVVAKNATVHLEKMDDRQFALIVETARERICVEVGARRAPVRGFESWRDRINRRGEAATRR